jgi:K+-transporting ATPase ATPase C chain
VQVDRIAKARNISADKIKALIDQQTEQPLLGSMGIAHINVLKLNIALDALK